MHRIHGVWQASDTLERWVLVAVIVAAVAQTLFIGVYATRPWWRVRVGRALMLKSASLCLLLLASVVDTFFVYAHQREVSAVIIFVVAAAIVYQLVALVLSPRHPEEAP